MTKITSENIENGRKNIHLCKKIVYFYCIYNVLILHLKTLFGLSRTISLHLFSSRKKKTEVKGLILSSLFHTTWNKITGGEN